MSNPDQFMEEIHERGFTEIAPDIDISKYEQLGQHTLKCRLCEERVHTEQLVWVSRLMDHDAFRYRAEDEHERMLTPDVYLVHKECPAWNNQLLPAVGVVIHNERRKGERRKS